GSCFWTVPGVTPGAGISIVWVRSPRLWSTLWALPADSPTTFGTGTGGGPALRVTRTVEPLSTDDPACGDCATTVPRGALEKWDTNFACSPARLALEATAAFSSPVRRGTRTCEWRPVSRTVAIMPPRTARTRPNAAIVRRRAAGLTLCRGVRRGATR